MDVARRLVHDCRLEVATLNHLVILHARYLDLILQGTKTVESRLSKRRHPAVSRCRPGDILYLKQKGGDILGRATVARITEIAVIPPGGVAELAKRWSSTVVGGGPADPYWTSKADARFALFIELTSVERIHISRQLLPRRLAWASAWIVGQPDEAVVQSARLSGCET